MSLVDKEAQDSTPLLNKEPDLHPEHLWIKIVTVFLYLTVIWSATEGAISIYGGYIHRHLSLLAFGFDSCIEVISASLVLFHMLCTSLPNHGNPSVSALFILETERRLTVFIGFLLILFCVFACIGGIYRLIDGTPPDSTLWGIVIGAVCVVVMVIMYYYKTKASVILNSATLSSDAACSFGCARLSAVLLIGSLCYEIWNELWWVDGVTAIIIGLLVGYEGYETVKNAIDKENFSGGVGCCGANESELAKYFKKQMAHSSCHDHEHDDHQHHHNHGSFDEWQSDDYSHGEVINTIGTNDESGKHDSAA